MSDLTYPHAVLLGVVEGLTEFLPVSSTGHLTVVEGLLGFEVDSPAITGFTATIQLGAILATLLYFARDIARLARAWLRGVRDPRARQGVDYRLAWYVLIGSLPVGIVGFALRDLITGAFRSLWVVAGALVVWSGVMWLGEKFGRQERDERELNATDAVVIGVVQCFSLVPGVSRSGATISAGLLRGLDRVTATRLSFFLAIPALTAAGLFELRNVDPNVVGFGPLLTGMAVSFIVALASIAWLLRFVSQHPITVFIWYRVALGIAIAVLLTAGLLTAN
ncbi:MAG: undecaprenyl-diphosphate phosphatase [Actinomycetota bacterium]